MIIHTTTLSTEEMVQNIYGSNTNWTQHSGYFLRGASSGVVANSTSSSGGNDDLITPYHNHGFTGTQISGLKTGNQSANHTHSVTGGNHRHVSIFSASGSGDYFTGPNASRVGNGSAFAYSGYSGSLTMTCGSNSANHTHTVNNFTPSGTVGYAGTNGNSANANIPKYKSVYIWERIA